MAKFVAKVEHEVAPQQLEWFYLALEKDQPVLVESVIGLFNKGFTLFDNAQEALQLAKDAGYPRMRLVAFDRQPDGKPFLESGIL